MGTNFLPGSLSKELPEDTSTLHHFLLRVDAALHISNGRSEGLDELLPLALHTMQAAARLPSVRRVNATTRLARGRILIAQKHLVQSAPLRLAIMRLVLSLARKTPFFHVVRRPLTLFFLSLLIVCSLFLKRERELLFVCFSFF